MYDSGVKNNVESPRLDLGVVIYVCFIIGKVSLKVQLLIMEFFLYRIPIFWDSKDQGI